ncbi:oligosaccharide flippase family protein [Fontivita pretiosa]|uniref:oligosaccharide flippase family protein n=1 Tax=Fontivita pretiosa TaxID=2989684 RepID=UPI003D166D68
MSQSSGDIHLLGKDDALAPVRSGASSASSATQNIGSRAARGMVWLSAQTIVTRITSFATQLALAWLLAPGDFGQVSLVYTITAFAALLNNPGVDEVLLQKQTRLRRWATAAFWLNVMLGLAGGALVALSGLAVHQVALRYGNAAYANPNVLWMTLILAAAAPLNAASMVPVVVLRSELRFARLAAVNLADVLMAQALSVALAALGCGPYSFVVPFLVNAVVRLPILWILARPPVHWRLSTHRWGSLIGSTRWVAGQRLFYSLTAIGDYLVLGALYDNPTLSGLYYFAFLLCAQIIQVLCNNVGAVLTPALNAMLGDRPRMEQATQRAMKSLAVMVVPAMALQILLAGPAIRLLFAHKWEPAIPLVQLLSLGPVLYTAIWPLASLLSASGRFRDGFYLWGVVALLFFAVVAPATWLGAAHGTAIGVSIWGWLAASCFAAGAYRSVAGIAKLFDAVWRPIVCALPAVAAASAILPFMPKGVIGDFLAAGIAASLMLGIYLAILHRVDRDAVEQLLHHLNGVLHPILSLAQRPVRSALWGRKYSRGT